MAGQANCRRTHKTIADFRKDDGPAIKKVCAQFVELCRKMGLLAKASVAIDGSKFKAVNNQDKNFVKAEVERRRTQLEQSVARYLAQLDTADRQERSETIEMKNTRLREKPLSQVDEDERSYGRDHSQSAPISRRNWNDRPSVDPGGDEKSGTTDNRQCDEKPSRKGDRMTGCNIG
jgi:hypothetical protein